MPDGWTWPCRVDVGTRATSRQPSSDVEPDYARCTLGKPTNIVNVTVACEFDMLDTNAVFAQCVQHGGCALAARVYADTLECLHGMRLPIEGSRRENGDRHLVWCMQFAETWQRTSREIESSDSSTAEAIQVECRQFIVVCQER